AGTQEGGFQVKDSRRRARPVLKEVTMTARSVLWLVLGLVGLPFLIEGSGGCGFSSQALPIDDNAYTCGCHCDATPVTKTVTIVANSDDAEQDGNGSNVHLGGNDLHLGANIVGLRFVN